MFDCVMGTGGLPVGSGGCYGNNSITGKAAVCVLFALNGFIIICQFNSFWLIQDIYDNNRSHKRRIKIPSLSTHVVDFIIKRYNSVFSNKSQVKQKELNKLKKKAVYRIFTTFGGACYSFKFSRVSLCS